MGLFSYIYIFDLDKQNGFIIMFNIYTYYVKIN